jgi:hypothetical protein
VYRPRRDPSGLTTAMQTLPILTNSRLKAFRRCQEYHHFRYNKQVVPRDKAPALHFGSAFHVGVEAWRLSAGSDQEERIGAAFAAAREIWTGDTFGLVRIEELLRGYNHRWASSSLEDPQNLLAIEKQWFMPLLRSDGSSSKTWQLAGKVDAISQDDSGRICLVENKTTSSDITPGGSYWKGLRLDGQVSLYWLAAQHMGMRPHSCVYDVSRRPLQSPLRATPKSRQRFRKDGRLFANQRAQDETLDEFRSRVRADIENNPLRYYQRMTLVRDRAELERYSADLSNLADQMDNVSLMKSWVRNTDACKQYGRLCSYFDVCTGETLLCDPYRFEILDTQHPELDLDNLDTQHPELNL